jgi:hypothetical protein
MRNDARPIGEGSPASPLGGHQGHDARSERPIESERPDSRDSVTHGRESHIVNRDAERRQAEDADDQMTPSSDAADKSQG